MVCFEIPIHKVKIAILDVEGENMMNGHLDNETRDYMNMKGIESLQMALGVCADRFGTFFEYRVHLRQAAHFFGSDEFDAELAFFEAAWDEKSYVNIEALFRPWMES
tara:strand:- start:352 stop:672 length:321 start_codon:yes stop_codon:yes gene_type:complete